MSVTPYLFFDGRCEEAIEFYKKTLGAEVGMMMRFKEAPEPHQPSPQPSNCSRLGSLLLEIVRLRLGMLVCGSEQAGDCHGW